MELLLSEINQFGWGLLIFLKILLTLTTGVCLPFGIFALISEKRGNLKGSIDKPLRDAIIWLILGGTGAWLFNSILMFGNQNVPLDEKVFASVLLLFASIGIILLLAIAVVILGLVSLLVGGLAWQASRVRIRIELKSR